MTRALLAILLATGCIVSDDGPRAIDAATDAATDAPGACPETGPGGPSTLCSIVVQDMADCPSVERLCRPDVCHGHTCCFCQAGRWQNLYTDCFEGCGNADAGVD